MSLDITLGNEIKNTTTLSLALTYPVKASLPCFETKKVTANVSLGRASHRCRRYDIGTCAMVANRFVGYHDHEGNTVTTNSSITPLPAISGRTASHASAQLGFGP